MWNSSGSIELIVDCDSPWRTGNVVGTGPVWCHQRSSESHQQGETSDRGQARGPGEYDGGMQDDTHRSPMMAVTIHPPWVWLIAAGAKAFETRGWPVPSRLIGQPLAIHGSRAALPRDLDAGTVEAMEAALGVPATRWPDMPRGTIVAVSRIAGCYRVGSWTPGTTHIEIDASVTGSQPLTSIELRGDEALFGNFGPGRWLWSLDNVTPFNPPVPARGHQRLWYWTPPPVA